MSGGQIVDVQAIRKFVLAGNARFTVVSKKTGTRFTFEVVSAPHPGIQKGEPAHFVALLTGPDRYSHLGTIFDLKKYRHGKKSNISSDAPSAQAFAWFWERLSLGGELGTCEFWHEGKCGKCGRALTVPESIATGLGPICGGT